MDPRALRKLWRHRGAMVGAALVLFVLALGAFGPYLAPHPERGRRNEPAHVVYVAQAMARLLGLPVEEVARRTSENACRLFGVDLDAQVSGDW